MSALSPEAKATVLVALEELALEMERVHNQIFTSAATKAECVRVLNRLVRAEAEVRAKC